MESEGDSWESVGWGSAWQQPEEGSDRDQVLRLARQLAEARERQNVEARREVEDLKRALRERAADVARRELEVEKRTRELEKLDGQGRDGRKLRLRRSGLPHQANDTYPGEPLARRESELQQRLDALVPRERGVAGRETALRARELKLQEIEAAVARREQEVAESKGSVERHRLELESVYARLLESEAELAQRQAGLEEQERLLETSRTQVSRETHERQAAPIKNGSAAEAEHKVAQLESQLAAREAELLAREVELLRLQSGLASQQESIRRRERALEDEERMRERDTVLPAAHYVSFSEGLDAFSGGRRSN